MRDREYQSPIDVVRDIYRAVADGDFDAVIARLSHEISVDQSSALSFAGRWEGHDGFRAMGAAIYECWPDFSVTPLAFFAADDTVLVQTRVTGACGALDQPMIERWKIVDGRAAECQPFYFDPTVAAATLQPGA